MANNNMQSSILDKAKAMEQRKKAQETLNQPNIYQVKDSNGQLSTRDVTYTITSKDIDGKVTKETRTSKVPNYVSLDQPQSKALTSGKEVKVYQQENGGWKTEAKPYASFDESSGKITVNLPSFAMENKRVVDVLDGLKELSAVYKKDNDYKLKVKNSKGVEETKSVKDLIQQTIKDDVNDQNTLSYLVKNVADGLKYRYSLAEGDNNVASQWNGAQMTAFKAEQRKNNIISMSDETLGILGQVALGPESARYDVKSGTRQAISDIESANFFRNLESYDPETKTAEIDDIMANAWNREKISDEQMEALVRDLNDYFASSDFSNQEEFARNFAMYQFLMGREPGVHFVRGAVETVGSVAEGVLTKATEVGVGLWGFAGDVLDLGIGAFVGALAAETNMDISMEDFNQAVEDTSKYFNIFKQTRTMDVLGGNQQEYKDFTDLLQKTQKQWHQDWMATEAWRSPGNVTASAIGYSVTELAGLISAGNVLSGAAKAGVGLLGSGIKNLAGATRAVEAGGRIADMALNGGKISTNLVNGFKTLTTFLGKNGTVKVLNALKGLTTGAAGVAGESLAEAIIQDPYLFRDVMTNPDLSQEAKTALWQSAAGNALGWGLGASAAKTLQKAGETALGQAISANMSRNINKMSVVLGDTLDAIRVKLAPGVSNIDELIEKVKATGKNANKVNVMEANREIRKARRAIAESDAIKIIGKEEDEILKQLDEFQDLAHNLRMREIAYDRMRGRGQEIQNKWNTDIKYKSFQEAQSKWQEANDNLVKAQKAAGLKPGTKVSGAGRLLNDDVSNYIEAQGEVLYQRRWLKKFSGVEPADKVAAHQKTLDDAQAQIKTFLDKATPELKEAADVAVAQYKAYSNEYMGLLAQEGLIGKAELDDLRKSGLWGRNGKDYMLSLRKTEMPKKYMVNRDGSLSFRSQIGTFGTSAGATGDFVDPNLAIAMDLGARAQQKTRLDFFDTYVNSGGAACKIDGRQTELVRRTKPIMSKLEKAGKENISSIVDDVEDANVADKIKAAFGQRKDLRRAERAQRRAAREVSRAQARTLPRATRKQVGLVIMDLPSDDVDEVFSRLHGGSDSVEEYLTANITKDRLISKNMPKAERDFLQQRLDAATDYDHRIEVGADGKALLTLDNYKLLRGSDDTLDADFRRVSCANTKELLTDPELMEMAGRQIADERIFNRETIYRDRAERFAELEENFRMDFDEMQDFLDETVDSYISSLLKEDSASGQLAEALSTEFASTNPELAKQYFATNILHKNKSKVTSKVRSIVKDSVENTDHTISASDSKAMSNLVGDWLDDVIEAKYNKLRNQMLEVNPEAVDMKEMYSQIRKSMSDITDAKAADDMVAIYNTKGELEYWQVSPMVADIINTQIAPKERGLAGRINYLWMKLFRAGTTGANLTSMVNQQFRDYGNAILVGGAYSNFKACAKELEQIFGKDMSKFIEQFEPEAIARMQQQAKETGESLARVMARNELEVGKAISPSAIESESLKLGTRGKAARYAETTTIGRTWDKAAGDAIDSTVEKLGKLNDVRETGSRNRVYANALNQGLKRGYSLEKARSWATYMMENVTTNFRRPLEHLTNLSDTVPYLRSAINGQKSFYRLWSMDPVGVTGRILGGMAIPVMALTAMSLSTEENRAIYKNIPTYMKEDSLPIVINGQAVFIPLPQELSTLIAPFRQLIEGVHGVQKYTFLQGLANDLIGLSPIEIADFSDLDSYKIFGDDNFGTWLSVSFTKTWSQLAPAPLKTAAIAFTKVDPYTGNKIDTTRKSIDIDTGEEIILDDDSGAFCQVLSDVALANGWDISGEFAEALLTNVIGGGGVKFADMITTLGQAVIPGGVVKGWEDVVQIPLEQIADPLTATIKDQANYAWKSAIAQLWEEKKSILNGQAWSDYLQAKRTATTDEQIEKVRAMRENIMNPFYDKTLKVVQNLQSQYQGQFTAEKFASTLSLLNMQIQTLDSGVYGDKLNEEVFYEGRSQALATMAEYGFPSGVGYENGISIFGQYKSNSNGEIYFSWNTPLQILELEDALKNQDKWHGAAIEAIIDQQDLYTKRKTYKERRSELLDNKKYDDADKVAVEWNTIAARALLPYIKEYTAEAVLGSYDTMDILEDLFMVPSSYEVDRRGRFISAPNLNKQQGFVRNYIKDIFKDY